MARQPKRSDITTEMVLTAVAASNRCADLYARFPRKVVEAALCREAAADRIDYGTTLRSAWVVEPLPDGPVDQPQHAAYLEFVGVVLSR